jgi:hypothetical protein
MTANEQNWVLTELADANVCGALRPLSGETSGTTSGGQQARLCASLFQCRCDFLPIPR